MSYKALLDHLVLLTGDLEAKVKDMEERGFTVERGGRHADGLTENALIVFEDGVYLELITFVEGASQAGRRSHWWGECRPGWIGWAVTPTEGGSSYEIIGEANARAERCSGQERWSDPVNGGRTTPSGKQLEWQVALPDPESRGLRGRLPFLCADKTPREWRVKPPWKPHSGEAEGITGISRLMLLCRPGQRAEYAAALSSIISPWTGSSEPQPTESFLSSDGVIGQDLSPARGGETAGFFELFTPTGSKIIVEVREPRSAHEMKYANEEGEGLIWVQMSNASLLLA